MNLILQMSHWETFHLMHHSVVSFYPSSATRIQQMIRSAGKITGCHLASVEELYTLGTSNGACKITLDLPHPGHYLFTLLPSGTQCLVDKVHTYKDFLSPWQLLPWGALPTSSTNTDCTGWRCLSNISYLDKEMPWTDSQYVYKLAKWHPSSHQKIYPSGHEMNIYPIYF